MTAGVAVGGTGPRTGNRPASPAPNLLRLHVPDEPDRSEWLRRVDLGTGVAEVLASLEQWLWDRWRLLGRAGMDRAAFGVAVGGYRRELWLWIVGERTWPHCCAGLIGRIGRRMVP